MIVVVPSIVIAFFLYDLGAFLEFCGIFSLVLSGITIPMISLAAERIIPEKSDYDFKYNYFVGISLLVSSGVVLLCSFISTSISYL